MSQDTNNKRVKSDIKDIDPDQFLIWIVVFRPLTSRLVPESFSLLSEERNQNTLTFNELLSENVSTQTDSSIVTITDD